MRKCVILAIATTVVTGCGVTNKSFNVKQDDVLAGRIEFEGKVSNRLAIAGSLTGYTVEEKQSLVSANRESFSTNADYERRPRDVVRVGDTFFQAPETITHQVKVKRAALDFKAFPINNEVAKFYVGGGLRFLGVSLNVSGPTLKAKESDQGVGFGPIVGVYFPIQSSFAASLNFSAHKGHKSTTFGRYFSGAIHWLPTDVLQVDHGIFNDSYDIEEEIDANWQYIEYDDCSADFQSLSRRGCPSEVDGTSDLNVEATGIFAGISVRF